MIRKKAHAQEFTDYLNTVDTAIEWMMEGVVAEDADEEIV